MPIACVRCAASSGLLSATALVAGLGGAITGSEATGLGRSTAGGSGGAGGTSTTAAQVHAYDTRAELSGFERVFRIYGWVAVASVTIVAALAALADRPSHLTGLAHMRGHETDRLAALTTELRRLGGDVHEEADGLVIAPAFLHGGTWTCYADHRMATAGALLGLRVDGVVLDDVACTGKTLPDFPGLWAAMIGD